MKLLSRPGALLAVFLFSAVLALGGAPAAAEPGSVGSSPPTFMLAEESPSRE